MRIQEIEYFDYMLGMLSTIQMSRTYLKNDDLLDKFTNCEICADYEWDLCYNALNSAVEFLSIRYIESYDCEEFFMSDETMTEYYRLCRVYGRKHGIKWEDNPYVENADSAVSGFMDLRDHGYQWRLSTGTRHKYASSLHFYRYGDFYQTVELIEAVFQVFEFYHTEIELLKAELNPEKKELIAA